MLRSHWDGYRDLTGCFFCTWSVFPAITTHSLRLRSILPIRAVLLPSRRVAAGSANSSAIPPRGRFLSRMDTVVCISSEKHNERTHRASARTLRTNPQWFRKSTQRTNPPCFGKNTTNKPPPPRRVRRKCAQRTQPPQTHERRKCAERTQTIEPPPARRNATKRSHFSQIARRNSLLASGIGRRKFFAKRSQLPIGGLRRGRRRRTNRAERTHQPNNGLGRKHTNEPTGAHENARNEHTAPPRTGENAPNEPTREGLKNEDGGQEEMGRSVRKHAERTHCGSIKDDERTYRRSDERAERTLVRENAPERTPGVLENAIERTQPTVGRNAKMGQGEQCLHRRLDWVAGCGQH